MSHAAVTLAASLESLLARHPGDADRILSLLEDVRTIPGVQSPGEREAEQPHVKRDIDFEDARKNFARAFGGSRRYSDLTRRVQQFEYPLKFNMTGQEPRENAEEHLAIQRATNDSARDQTVTARRDR